VIVDTPGEAFCAAVREGVYLLKPNLRELSELVDHELKDEAQQEEAAVEIVQSGQSEAVVLSLGAAGVLMISATGCERLRTPTVPIVSKVGAGDSMVAGIVLSLARGMSLREAVLFGVAACAAAVMTPGTELCRRDECRTVVYADDRRTRVIKPYLQVLERHLGKNTLTAKTASAMRGNLLSGGPG
jgi:6-phosphofructokinase 2